MALTKPRRTHETSGAMDSRSMTGPFFEVPSKDIGAEVAAKVALGVAVPGHDRFEHVLPAVRRMDVARTQRALFEVAELVEHEQRMITEYTGGPTGGWSPAYGATARPKCEAAAESGECRGRRDCPDPE